MSAMNAEIETELSDGVAWIALNRPAKANALTATMLEEVDRALDAYAADSLVRAIVLTGKGNRSFSAGADLTPLPQGESHVRERRSLLFASVMRKLLRSDKPCVAAVNGAACGYGMMLAMVCDMTVASQTARFALSEIRKGISTLVGASILRHRFGSAWASDLVLSGRFVHADEALSRGLVQQVVPEQGLRDCAQSLARQLGESSAHAYAQTKHWLNRSLLAEVEMALEASQERRHTKA